MRSYREENEEREVRKHQEFKLFVEAVVLLLIMLFAVVKFSNMAFADEVTLANQPYNVGGNNGFKSIGDSFIIDISSDRSEESNLQQATDITNGPDAASQSDTANADISSEPSGTSIMYADESHKQSHEENVGTNGNDIDGNQTGSVTATNGDEIYVPDSDDDCPVSSLVPLPEDVQEYIWNHCKKVTGDYKNYYAFILGAIQLESEFKSTAIHHNSNGSTDRGLMQINSCNIKECKRAGLISCTDDLWDIYKNIDCGFHEMNDYVKKFGVCESAYFAYNTGRTSGGSNKNSRVVMNNMAQWNAKLFG